MIDFKAPLRRLGLERALDGISLTAEERQVFLDRATKQLNAVYGSDDRRIKDRRDPLTEGRRFRSGSAGRRSASAAVRGIDLDPKSRERNSLVSRLVDEKHKHLFSSEDDRTDIINSLVSGLDKIYGLSDRRKMTSNRRKNPGRRHISDRRKGAQHEPFIHAKSGLE